MVYKTLIPPLVGFVCLALQQLGGIQIDAVVQNDLISGLINVISAVVIIYGIFKNHNITPSSDVNVSAAG